MAHVHACDAWPRAHVPVARSKEPTCLGCANVGLKGRLRHHHLRRLPRAPTCGWHARAGSCGLACRQPAPPCLLQPLLVHGGVLAVCLYCEDCEAATEWDLWRASPTLPSF